MGDAEPSNWDKLRYVLNPESARADRWHRIAQEQRQRAEAAEHKLSVAVEALRRVRRNDKTVYTYDGKNALRGGERPPAGERWLTPRDIADAALREIGEDDR